MSCARVLAGNIVMDCDNPLVGGYVGDGLIVSLASNPVIVADEANPRKIKSITAPQGGVYKIENAVVTPFSGSTTAGNADNGYREYLKTISFTIPLRGADASRDVVEPLFNDPYGFIMVLPKRDRVGDGGFEVIGYKSALRGDITTLSRDENANGGSWQASLSCREPYAEVTLIGEDGTYESAKTAYDNLEAAMQVGVVSLSMSEKKKIK